MAGVATRAASITLLLFMEGFSFLHLGAPIIVLHTATLFTGIP